MPIFVLMGEPEGRDLFFLDDVSQKIFGFSKIGPSETCCFLWAPVNSGASEIPLSLRFPLEIYRPRFCEHRQAANLDVSATQYVPSAQLALSSPGASKTLADLSALLRLRGRYLEDTPVFAEA